MSCKYNSTTRRTFLGMGALGLASTAVGAAPVKPRQKSASDLLKIGLILGEWAHSQNGWGRILNGIVGEQTYPRMTGMYYSHIWHIKRDVAEEYAKKYGVGTVVNSFDGMIGKVDGVIIDTIFQTPWVHRLARPYLEAGIPVFSDRPFADAVWKVKETIELAKKYKTPFWSGSSLEQMYTAVEVVKNNPPESILGYETWSDGQVDFYSHGLHGLWWTYRTTGGGIHAIAQKMEALKKGGGISTIIHKDKGNGPFLGKITHTMRDDCLIYTKFKGSDRVYRYDDNPYDGYFIYLPLLLKVQEMFFYGEKGLPETYDRFLEKCKLFIAGFRSILRANGGFVELDTLDEDWAIGAPWGHKYMSGTDVYQAYTKLFGPEKGELRPPR